MVNTFMYIKTVRKNIFPAKKEISKLIENLLSTGNKI